MIGVAGMLNRRGLDSVLIVTDPYHSLRSRLIAEEFGLDAYVSPTDTSVVTGGSNIVRHLQEAAGVAVGRHHRLRSALTPVPGARSRCVGSPADTLLRRSSGEWCNRQHSRFWICY